MLKTKVFSILFVLVFFASPAFSYTSSYTGAEIDEAIEDVRSGTVEGDNVESATTSGRGTIEIATDVEAANSTVTDKAVTPSQLVSATSGYQGLQWNESTDAYTRTGTIAWAPTGSSPGDAHLPVQDSMRPCVINTNAEVQYYLDEDDVTLKADGGNSTLDGTDGQVVVEIKKFYYDYDKEGNLHEWKVGPAPFPGCSVHPAFVGSNGTVYENIYIGRYEGVLYDNSSGGYINSSGDHTDILGDASSETIDTANDYLGSVTGFIPLSDETRAEFRTLSSNNGGHLESVHDAMAYLILAVIEYGDFNLQDVLGEGKTNNDSSHDYVASTGESDGAGQTGSAPASTSTSTDGYVVYRNIENIYGNIWKFTAGMNVNNDGTTSKLYIVDVNDPSLFADGTADNYTYVGDLAESDGYVDTLLQTSSGIFPSTVGASSSTKIGDYFYTYFDSDPNSGWRIALRGGPLNYGLRAGGFYWRVGASSGYDGWDLGGRAVWKKER